MIRAFFTRQRAARRRSKKSFMFDDAFREGSPLAENGSFDRQDFIETMERSQGVLQSKPEQPLLSIIVAARNDDHGGNFLRRMQIFVDGLHEQAARFGLNSELIIVEWNPPAAALRLADALRWPTGAGPCRIRIVEVPPSIHNRFSYSDKLGLFQMIAKNVGIRRSRGRFVLCTNVDVLFSSELVKFLASGRLDRRCMYRVDRLDVSADVPVGVSVDEQLEFCRRHVVRVNTRWATLARGKIGSFVAFRKFFEPAWMSFWVPLWTVVRMLGWAAWFILQWVIWLAYKAACLTIRHSLKENIWRFLTSWRVGRLRGALTELGENVHLYRRARMPSYTSYFAQFVPLHTNACGDFTLLPRAEWFRLRGYPEWEMFSYYLDGVLCHMAHRSGIREVVLKGGKHLYHIDHHSGWSPETGDSLIQRMNAVGVPIILDYERRVKLINEFPVLFNDENWGLAGEDLAEADPVAACMTSGSLLSKRLGSL